jgi:hypothetical protein
LPEKRALNDSRERTLARLADKGDQPIPTAKLGSVYRGVAVSKSETNIHLAVDHGVISIPLSAITSVREESYVDPNVVSVEVDDVAQVKNVFFPTSEEMSPRTPGLFRLSGGRVGMDAARVAIEAVTITGGVPDACDQLPEGTIIVIA